MRRKSIEKFEKSSIKSNFSRMTLSNSKNHSSSKSSINYEKLAMPAFIIVVIIAIVLFYFIYTGKIGMSIADTKKLACIQAGLSTEECALVIATPPPAKGHYCWTQHTLQNSGCTTINAVCHTVNSVIAEERVQKEIIPLCPIGDYECIGEEYVANFAPKKDTTSIYEGMSDTPLNIHKEVCP